MTQPTIAESMMFAPIEKSNMPMTMTKKKPTAPVATIREASK